MKRIGVVLLAAATFAAACDDGSSKRKSKGDDDESSTTSGNGSGGGFGVGAGGSTSTDPNGPQFLDFGTNVDTLYEGESLTFTAVLTDPDGVDDVIGGSLKDANGASYGAFVTSGQEGSYEVTVDWWAINQVGEIDFAYGAAMSRGFIAEFYDADGHVSSKETTIKLTCDGGLQGCGGICFDTMNDDANCGACDNHCAGDLCVWDAFCQQGQCVGEQQDCSELDGECATGVCEPSTGNCVVDPAPDNSSCDDGDECTADEFCSSGECGGGTPLSGGVLFSDDFADNNAGWQLDTEWDIGPATSSSGHSQHNADPATDHSASADDGVAGVNIGGNAGTTAHGYYYLTSPAIDAEGTEELSLSFYRWLNSDYDPYMNNVVEVFNGTAWVEVWEQGGTATKDSAWTPIVYDITQYANASLKVRFGFKVGTNPYVVSSWNLDDVEVTASGLCE